MKTAIAGTVLTVLTISLPVLANNKTGYNFKGQNASISFYQFDECNSKSVYIFASSNRTKNAPGAPTEQMGADISYYNYNNCTGEYSSGSGSSPNAKFTLDNQLSSGTLTGTFAVYDYLSDTTKTAEVNLTFTGIGLSYKGKNTSFNQTPTIITRSRSTGEYREAQVSGSVILDGINLVANTASSGNLSLTTSGYYEWIAK